MKLFSIKEYYPPIFIAWENCMFVFFFKWTIATRPINARRINTRYGKTLATTSTKTVVCWLDHVQIRMSRTFSITSTKTIPKKQSSSLSGTLKLTGIIWAFSFNHAGSWNNWRRLVINSFKFEKDVGMWISKQGTKTYRPYLVRWMKTSWAGRSLIWTVYPTAVSVSSSFVTAFKKWSNIYFSSLNSFGFSCRIWSPRNHFFGYFNSLNVILLSIIVENKSNVYFKSLHILQLMVLMLLSWPKILEYGFTAFHPY